MTGSLAAKWRQGPVGSWWGEIPGCYLPDLQAVFFRQILSFLISPSSISVASWGLVQKCIFSACAAKTPEQLEICQMSLSTTVLFRTIVRSLGRSWQPELWNDTKGLNLSQKKKHLKNILQITVSRVCGFHFTYRQLFGLLRGCSRVFRVRKKLLAQIPGLIGHLH